MRGLTGGLPHLVTMSKQERLSCLPLLCLDLSPQNTVTFGLGAAGTLWAGPGVSSVSQANRALLPEQSSPPHPSPPPPPAPDSPLQPGQWEEGEGYVWMLSLRLLHPSIYPGFQATLICFFSPSNGDSPQTQPGLHVGLMNQPGRSNDLLWNPSFTTGAVLPWESDLSSSLGFPTYGVDLTPSPALLRL